MKEQFLHKQMTSGFQLPEGYFDNLEDQLMSVSKLKLEVPNAGFEVPDTYFDSLENKISRSIHLPKETKVISLVTWKTVVATMTVAASLILMFNIVNDTDDIDKFDSIETASIEHYLWEEDFSEDELATLLEAGDLTTEHFVDDLIPEDNLKDYLLDNADIELLLVE